MRMTDEEPCLAKADGAVLISNWVFKDESEASLQVTSSHRTMAFWSLRCLVLGCVDDNNDLLFRWPVVTSTVLIVQILAFISNHSFIHEVALVP